MKSRPRKVTINILGVAGILLGIYAGIYLSIRTWYHSYSNDSGDILMVSLGYPFTGYRSWFEPCIAVDKLLTGKKVVFAPDDFPMKREFRRFPFNQGGRR